jgi:hypothetical protein
MAVPLSPIEVQRKRNAILDLIFAKESSKTGWILYDDLEKLVEKKNQIELTGNEALERMEILEILFSDSGATLGGFDYSPDRMKLKDFQPFSLARPLFGAVLVNVADGLRYDTDLRINEDVDFWVQKMEKGRFLMKDNRFFTKFFGEDGGNESVIKYTTSERQEVAKQINKKWGYPVMSWTGKRFDFKIPIKGA